MQKKKKKGDVQPLSLIFPTQVSLQSMDLPHWIQFSDARRKKKKNRDQYPVPQKELYSLQQEHFHLEVHNTYSPKGT